jgi:thiamine biosynthesis protein ThiS
MTILFDERNIKIEEDIDNIEFLCKYLKIDKESGIAVSINDLIIPRWKWNIVKIDRADKIIIIKATQGG